MKDYSIPFHLRFFVIRQRVCQKSPFLTLCVLYRSLLVLKRNMSLRQGLKQIALKAITLLSDNMHRFKLNIKIFTLRNTRLFSVSKVTAFSTICHSLSMTILFLRTLQLITQQRRFHEKVRNRGDVISWLNPFSAILNFFSLSS